MVTHTQEEIFQPTLPARGATAKGGELRYSLLFQPTLPARGATCGLAENRHGQDDFNPRSPHGERHDGTDKRLMDELISTHAPRTGSDAKAAGDAIRAVTFQPTLPARGATLFIRRLTADVSISTHAPRTGSDVIATAFALAPNDFNPRSPHGERRGKSGLISAGTISTHAPRTGSDSLLLLHFTLYHISTHAPRTGSDIC